MPPRITLPVLVALLFPAALAAQERIPLHTGLEPRVLAPEEGERRHFPDGRHMLLKVGPENTGASYLFLGAEDLPPGSEIPRHRHEVDEEILVVHRGEVTFELAGRRHRAGPGSVVYLPPRTWISARNEGRDTASIMFVFPRGAVERCFQFLGVDRPGEAPDAPTEAEQREERRSCQMTYERR